MSQIAELAIKSNTQRTEMENCVKLCNEMTYCQTQSWEFYKQGNVKKKKIGSQIFESF